MLSVRNGYDGFDGMGNEGLAVADEDEGAGVALMEADEGDALLEMTIYLKIGDFVRNHQSHDLSKGL